MTNGPNHSAARIGRGLETTALVIVLACMAARTGIGELEFRNEPTYSALKAAAATADKGRPVEPGYELSADRGEVARATFAMVLLGAGAIWLAGGALQGRLAVRGLPALVFVGAFAVVSLASACLAPDKRTALDGWLDTLAVLTTGLLTMQLCADRTRLAAVLIVLTGLAGALGIGAIVEYTLERPAYIAEFNRDPEAWLTQVGIRPGTPSATAFSYRARDRAVLGPIGMATPFAGLMVLLGSAAAGLAAQKIAAARAARPAWSPTPGKGEIHLPTLAAWVTLPLALTALAAVPLTQSKGGLVAGAVGLTSMALLWRYRRQAAEHWRRNLAMLGGVLLAGGFLLVAWGVKNDSLPSRTMTVRWHYWTGAMDTLTGRPYLGTGPGNFGTLYLKNRSFGADEEIKSPHNVIVEALSTYGVVGGGLYLAILAGMLVRACRPASGPEPTPPAPRANSPGAGATIAACVLGVAATKLLAGGMSAAGKELEGSIVLAFLPAALLGATLTAAWWAGAKLRALPNPGPWARVALVVGLFAFVLDNMVCYGIWRPGIATVFWASAGAAVAWAGAGREYVLCRARWAPFAAAAAGWVALLVVLYVPVARRAALAEEAVGALNARDFRAAAVAAVAAASVDELDAIAAFEAAHACRLAGDPSAVDWAFRAVERNPFEAGYYRLLADMLYERDNAARKYPEPVVSPDVLMAWERAVYGDPNNIRLRLDHARVLLAARLCIPCLRELELVERLDAALFEGSPDRLSPQDKRDVADMRRRCP
ncbi:MAG: O-antigen ligase family protein [Planctomycetota bacterium]|nr:O-antigen ligase family protein [Planctomycetota bacterium]